MIFRNSRKGQTANCRCQYNFTCGECLKVAEGRNAAEYAANPQWHKLALIVKPSPCALNRKKVK